MPPSDRVRLGHRAATLTGSRTAEVSARVRALVASGVDVVNLSSGELDFDTPPAAGLGGIGAIVAGHTRYAPVAGLMALREAIAERLAIEFGAPHPPTSVVVTNGAKQALANAFSVLLDPGDEVLLPAPYWVSLPHVIRLAGGIPVVCHTDRRSHYQLTAELVRAHVTSKTKALVLNNPTNPTGTVYGRHRLTEIAMAALEHGLLIVADEVYGDLVYEPAEFIAVSSLGPEVRSVTVTVGGFSKAFAMTGWRLGYAVAPEPISAALQAWQGHTTSAASSISQHAALAMLRDDGCRELLAARRTRLARRRDTLLAGLNGLPSSAGLELATHPDGTFFAFVDVGGRDRGGGERRRADQVADRLLREAQVAVMPADAFGCPHHLRVSFGVPSERMTEAFRRIHAHYTESADPIPPP